MFTEESLKKFGQRIAELRKLKYPRDTTDDFAVRAGCSRKTLYRIENGLGGSKIDTYLNIAEVLGVQNQFAELFNPSETKADQEADMALDFIMTTISGTHQKSKGRQRG